MCSSDLSLSGTMVFSVNPDEEEDLILMIGAMNPESFARRLENYAREKLIVVVGDRLEIQNLAITERVRVLVVTGGLPISPSMVDFAKKQEVSLLLREVHHRGRDGQSAGDDEDADAFRDGEVLDFQAVPDDDDELFARVVIQAAREGLGVHRADHEDQILFLVGVHGEHHGPAEGPVEVAQRGDDAA